MEDRYLFRGKRTGDGKWVIWDAITGIPHDLYIQTKTICQCTGLRDKNGKLIWEYDIVCHSYCKWNETIRKTVKKNYMIKWDNTMAHCGYRYRNGRNIFPFKARTSLNGNDEVIGNVFDDPELLEVQE